MATSSMSFMKKKSSSSFALTSLLRPIITKSIAVFFFVSVALFTNIWFVHSEQVSAQQEDKYQVYDHEQLRLLEHDPEYERAANIIANDKCAYLLTPCSTASKFEVMQYVLSKEEGKEKSDLWPSFEVGNWVYLCAETGRIYSRDSEAFYSRMIYLGPFPVIQKVGVGHDSGTTGRYNYKLAMPSVLNYLHPVLHGSMLDMENVLNKKLGFDENPGAHWISKLPDNVVSNGCRIFRPEDININIPKVHEGDSFMSIMTSIGLCITTYVLLCLLCAVQRLIFRT